MTNAPVFGVCGWKNSGKTTLTCRLVEEFSRRGLKVSTVKHAHHSFEIDKPGTDSFKHREAGANEVTIVSKNRWANIKELSSEPELSDVLQTLAPCDLVLVEGYKNEPHSKIETIRKSSTKRPPVYENNNTVKAIACVDPLGEVPVPVFSQTSVSSIADFILNHLKIGNSNAAE